MAPIDINVSNHIELNPDTFPEKTRNKHLHKTEKSAQRVLNAHKANRKALLIKTLGYNKKLLVKLLKDVLEGVAFTAIKIIPGVLAILL
jgi:hypothetical protein